ncbi:MAG: helix-hairpin-helix domain-containing protein [Faecalibacterium sp.]|nr:helix-hairpin-helix domain-containing protein [Faecalibacterium sp.]
MRETHLCTALRREILFIAACAAAAVLCVGLAFWFAVPQQPSQKQLPPDSTPLSEHWYVDLNTADAAALCTLPGVGPSRARALIEYRQQHGPFARVADAAAVPAQPEELVAPW